MSKEVLKIALEALEPLEFVGKRMDGGNPKIDEAITAIKEALAQPEQEPVGKFAKFTDGIWRELTDGSAGVPLYKHLSQRTWLGLTGEEIEASKPTRSNDAVVWELAVEWAEAKLKEKNT